MFGPGCTNLNACGVSVQSIAALHSFVTSTNGGLLALNLGNCAVSPDATVPNVPWPLQTCYVYAARDS